MKIVFLAFPLGKLGGIKTAQKYLEIGFRQLGVYYENYFISLNKKKLPELDKSWGWKVLGFEKKEWLDNYFRVVNKFDLVIWTVACPHELKNYHDTEWKKLFDIKPKQLAIIHDPYYEKYYRWYSEIPSKYNIRIICPAQHMLDGIKRLEAMKKIIPNAFCICEHNKGLFNNVKENIVVDANNWKLARRKVELIKVADKIKGEIISFGDQTQLPFYLAKKEKNFNLVIHKGWSSREEILKTLEKAKVSTDLIGGVDTIMDYTILEAISKGAVPLTLVPFGKPYNKFFKGVVSSKYTLAKDINNILKNFEKFNDLRINNLNNLDVLKPAKIAEEYLKYSEEKYEVTRSKGVLF